MESESTFLSERTVSPALNTRATALVLGRREKHEPVLPTVNVVSLEVGSAQMPPNGQQPRAFLLRRHQPRHFQKIKALGFDRRLDRSE
jgi:hypothetical protein